MGSFSARSSCCFNHTSTIKFACSIHLCIDFKLAFNSKSKNKKKKKTLAIRTCIIMRVAKYSKNNVHAYNTNSVMVVIIRKENG